MLKRNRFVLLVIALAAGCVSTQVTNSWKNPTYAGNLPSRILVVGMVPDVSTRHQIEDLAAAKLRANGAQAIPSYSLMPPSTKVTQKSVKEVLDRDGFDGLLVSHYRGREQTVSYYGPPYYYGRPYGYGPYAYGYGPYLDLWSPYYGPGYATISESNLMETTLFDTHGDGQVIWSGSSSTFLSGSTRQDMKHYVATVMTRMEKEMGLRG